MEKRTNRCRNQIICERCSYMAARPLLIAELTDKWKQEGYAREIKSAPIGPKYFSKSGNDFKK